MAEKVYLATEQKQDAIQTTVNTVNTNVSSVKTDVSTVNSNVSNVKSTVDTINTNVNSNKSTLASVLSKVNSLPTTTLSTAIKSVQRGVSRVGSGGVWSVPISSVNPSKCIVILNGAGNQTSNNATPTVLLESLTSMQLSVSMSIDTGLITYSWQVIEFY